LAMDKVPKTVFSNTLKHTGWNSAKLATNDLKKEVLALKQQSHTSKEIFVGSRSLIIQLFNLNLIDEFQICIHPMIVGKGPQLFDQLKGQTVFKLLKTKTFDSGSIVLYYQPIKK